MNTDSYGRKQLDSTGHNTFALACHVLFLGAAMEANVAPVLKDGALCAGGDVQNSLMVFDIFFMEGFFRDNRNLSPIQQSAKMPEIGANDFI